MVPPRLEHVPAPPTRSEILKPIGCLNILVFSKMATERVLGGVALRRAKSAVSAEVVEHEISYMQSYRDLDVPRVCQASPRGVATKAQDKLNGRLIKREISQPEYEILWNQINSARRVGKIYT